MSENRPSTQSPLIGVEELRHAIETRNGGDRAVVLDVRWQLGRSDGRESYLAGHIPDALFVDLPAQLARAGKPTEGRHPLPDIRDFARSLQQWGVEHDSMVVVYDDWNSQSAARAWWLLTAAGISDVRVLDGGLSAWLAAGHALSVGSEQSPARSGISVSGYQNRSLSMDDAAALAQTGILLDARAGERYRGEEEPIDPRAGHIPGAINAPTSENLDERGRFLPAEALRARFEQLGVTSGTAVGAYCGSGITASHEILAMRIAGLDAALYPGSWSEWSNHPDRPIATG